MEGFAVRLLLQASIGIGFAAFAAAAPEPMERTSRVVANDNRTPGGIFDQGTLTLSLRAGRGEWRPEGDSGPVLSIEAFGESSGALSVPAPLIRVVQGTVVDASISNELDAPLVVRGLCARDNAVCPPLTVPAEETRRVQFIAAVAGTYHYWASTIGAPVPFRELAGAFVVDAPEAAARDTGDRIFVITEWSSLTAAQLGAVFNADDPGKAFVALRPQATFMINGLSWPATERLTYGVGDRARWRIVNLSSQAHPMHLHGFYFEVESRGNGLRDVPIMREERQSVVTELVPSGGTMSMTWIPEREGNWLFHCHIMHHVSPERRIAPNPDPADHHDHQDSAAGMAGMILGVSVRKAAASPDGPRPVMTARRLTLTIAKSTQGADSSFGFSLSGDQVPVAVAAVSTPGPTLVLRRGEPVEIAVVNQLHEATALHWHGMELESYYDGVHRFSGVGRKVAPMIEPGRTFVVRFTPPRTGTFMYHTHLHDERQLPLGLYGAMLVVDPEEAYDPSVDHALLIGRHGLDPAAPNVFIPATPMVINGDRAPVFVWKAGSRHRVRLINITPDDIVNVSLQTSQGPRTWTPITKDGAPVPESSRSSRPSRQTIAVGETYDFEVDLPPGRQTLWLEVRSAAGKWEAQAQVIVR